MNIHRAQTLPNLLCLSHKTYINAKEANTLHLVAGIQLENAERHTHSILPNICVWFMFADLMWRAYELFFQKPELNCLCKNTIEQCELCQFTL